MQTAFITWTEKMSVGVALLDDEHKRLVSLLNDLHDGIVSGHGTERLGRVLDGVANYARIHFAHEEEFFAQSEYPAAAEHIKEHESMTRMVADIQDRYKKGKFDALSLETLNFLKDWLQNHVLGSDMNYTEHLNANGIH
jgi:hemerythrin